MAQAPDGGVRPEGSAGAQAVDGLGAQPEPGSPLPQRFRVEVPERSRGAAEHPLVVFHGNLLFSEHVLRSLLALPPSARATPDEARAVAVRLHSLLRSLGYDLATVSAEVQGDQIVVEVDEGQLDKIVIFGSGLVETIRFKLELVLPESVFDRLRFEQQLREFAQRYHLNQYSYELVPVEAQQGAELQLESLEPVLGLPRLRKGQRYELHVLIASNPWSRGFSPELSLNSTEGLGIGGRYRRQSVVFNADRWEGRAEVAANLRSYLDTSGARLVFSRALGELRWASPPILDVLRPALRIRADFLSLQRADLRLQNFDLATLGASLDFSWAALPQLTVTGGTGVERRFLFALEELGASYLLDETPKAQTRYYVELVADAVFNTRELRMDRKHELEAEARWYAQTPSTGQALWLRGHYQYRLAFGWHELWLRASGAYLAGQVLFPDEDSIGDYLRGTFGSSMFTRLVIGTGLEFRLSLLRDAVKVGLFYDQVVFGSADRSGGPTLPVTAGAGGPSLHLLLADEFELGIYLAFGWTMHGDFGFSPNLTLKQVF